MKRVQELFGAASIKGTFFDICSTAPRALHLCSGEGGTVGSPYLKGGGHWKIASCATSLTKAEYTSNTTKDMVQDTKMD